MLPRSRAMPVVRSLLILVLAISFVARPAAGEHPNVAAVRNAAEGGEIALGIGYMEGRVVPEDFVLAEKWFRKGAEQGNARAQYLLGALFQWGKGVPMNEATAVMWFTRAAKQDLIKAHETLGEMYRDGKGVKKDDAIAVKWFRRAAERGDALAQFTLGAMYHTGRGVALDPVEAHKWFMLAAALDRNAERAKEFAVARDDNAAMLTKAQVAEAQKRARDWTDARPTP